MKNSLTIVNKQLYIVFLAIFAFLLGSCKRDANISNIELNKSVKIQAFVINGITGVIDESKDQINISMPFGTDLTSVKPNITVPEGATVIPAIGGAVDLSSPVIFRVNNGNIFKKYTVKAIVQPPIVSFVINNVAGSVNDASHTITVRLPPGTNLSDLTPVITLAPGITIEPASGTQKDFTGPVIYKVTSSVAAVDYTVNVTVPYIAFLGTSAKRSNITDGDEKTAADWMFATYPSTDYISFSDIKSGVVDLSKYQVIWWHYNVWYTLPDIAFDAQVVEKLKAYYTGGGNLFLSTYAALYAPTIGIVPVGRGSNNFYGDVTPWIDPNNSWGLSWVGNESHPLFQGLEQIPGQPSNAYLLSKGTYRTNKTAWWKVNEWGGYGDAAGWRNLTGGIDLATQDGQPNRDNTLGIAEFPATAGHGKAIIIGMGAYDWFNEPSPVDGSPSPANPYKSNIERLTENTIEYLLK